jgi:predicted transglutaminase-like cysteine proteinase
MYYMAFNKLALVAAILGGAVAAIGVAQAAPRAAVMTTTGASSQPIGHYEFCQSHRAECSVRSKRDTRVRLTPQKWNELVAVNADVNRTIVAATDEEIYGRPEVWAYPDKIGEGDCEDLVLLKRRDLIAKGWPTGALLITVVRQRNGDGHAVLTVLTDRGDLVLDNLEPRVLVWSDTDYEFIKRQSEFDSGQWTGIEDARDVAVGSVSH